MVLLELFDAVYPYITTVESETLFSAKFDAEDGQEVKVEIEYFEGPSHWEAAFTTKGKRGYHSISATGEGDEYRIFGTVIKIISDFVKVYDPEVLMFTASKSDGNRAKLYDKMVRKYIPTGYTYNVDHNKSEYQSYFVLKKNQP